jgi:hypothetical protein
MFPSFPCYKEGTGGRGQIEPGPPVVGPACLLLFRTSLFLFYTVIFKKTLAAESQLYTAKKVANLNATFKKWYI